MKRSRIIPVILSVLAVIAVTVAADETETNKYVNHTLHTFSWLIKRSQSPQCDICPNDVAVCCPVRCGPDGKCPEKAKDAAGYFKAGKAIAQRNE